MNRYLLRRVLLSIVQLWLVVTVIFSFIHILPGDPAGVILGSSESYQATPGQLAMVRKEMGLDRPVLEQYTVYMGKLLKGDFGKSLITGRSVALDLKLRFERTLQLVIPSVLLSSLIGVVIGLITARYHGKAADLVLTTIGLVAYSMPSFVFGILLVLIFAIKMGMLPSSGFIELSVDTGKAIFFMVLPVITLGARGAATVMRMTRMAVMENILLDYVRTARAKGLSESVVLIRHVLRNALLPVVTVIGLQFGSIFAGAVIVESIFNWPGLSSLLLYSINSRDYPLIQGAMLVLSAIFVVTNLITDLSYAYLDPRISINEGGK